MRNVQNGTVPRGGAHHRASLNRWPGRLQETDPISGITLKFGALITASQPDRNRTNASMALFDPKERDLRSSFLFGRMFLDEPVSASSDNALAS